MDKDLEEEVAHAAFGLGSFMGILMKLKKVDPVRASDLYQQVLRYMPPEELIKFAKNLKPEHEHVWKGTHIVGTGAGHICEDCGELRDSQGNPV